MACQAALHPCMGIVAGPKRQEDCRSEVELMMNQPSSCEELNQAAGVAIRGPGQGLPVQRAGTRSRVAEEEKRSALFCSVFPHAVRNAKPPRLPKEVQTVSERPPWESLR